MATLDKQNIQYSYDFVVLCCVGALPKKDKIDPWGLAMLGIGSVRPGFIRPKSGFVCPDN
jgi:hypothetical protein